MARLDPIKNHYLLIKATSILRTEFPLIRLLLIGDGPLKKELQLQVSKQGLDEHVVFAGAITDTAPFIVIFDVFVLPSCEGSSMSVLEAMASGAAIIATAVGALRICWLESVASWFDRMMSILLQRRCTDFCVMMHFARNTDGRQRARAVAEFNEADMVQKYVALYRQVISRSEQAGE